MILSVEEVVDEWNKRAHSTDQRATLTTALSLDEVHCGPDCVAASYVVRL